MFRLASLTLRLGLAVLAAGTLATSASAQDKLRFAVGPFQPTPADTRKAYEPFFKHIADKLGRHYELVVTTDWAGISIALANKQADIAWMGPWGYVLANDEGGAQAIATVKYHGKPSYHAIIVGRPDSKIEKWPRRCQGLATVVRRRRLDLGLADPDALVQDAGHRSEDATSSIATAPRTPPQILSVINGQVDLATDLRPQHEQLHRARHHQGRPVQGGVDLRPAAERSAGGARGLRSGLDQEDAGRRARHQRGEARR